MPATGRINTESRYDYYYCSTLGTISSSTTSTNDTPTTTVHVLQTIIVVLVLSVVGSSVSYMCSVPVPEQQLYRLQLVLRYVVEGLDCYTA